MATPTLSEKARDNRSAAALASAGPAARPAIRQPGADAVRAECLRTLYGQARQAVIGMGVGTCAIAVLMWGHVESWRIVLWVALLFGQGALRWQHVQAFQRAQAAGASDAATLRWGWSFLVAHGFTGLCWGTAAWLMLPAGEPLRALFLLVAIVLVCTVVTLQSAPWYTAGATLICICLAVAGTALAFAEAPQVRSYALLLLPAGLSLLAVGWPIHRSFVTSIGLRFENAELVRQLERRSEEAERANRAKTQFLAAASHDLRQPLHALGLLVGTLARVADAAERSRIEEGIARAVQSLQSLLGALLDISKLDAQAVHAVPQPVALQALFDRLGVEFAALADEKGLLFKVRPTPRVVASDPLLLERILRNLLANALRYTRSGGVLLAARARRGGVAVEVWDTGPGIAERQREAVFEEFVQLENPERDREKGLGLGLAIVRRLAGLLGHEVALASRVGRGSVFRVQMAPSAAESGAHAGGAGASGPNAGDELAGLRVLVLDDEADVRIAMAMCIAGWGGIPLVAGSPEEALRIVDAGGGAPQAIVSDYRLREGMDGVRAVAALRVRLGRVPALIVSGDTSPQRIAELEAAGLPYLHKPVEPERLHEALCRLVAAR